MLKRDRALAAQSEGDLAPTATVKKVKKVGPKTPMKAVKAMKAMKTKSRTIDIPMVLKINVG